MTSGKIVAVIIAALILVSWCSPKEVKAEEVAKTNYSLVLGGISHHASGLTHKSGKGFNENNPMIGFRVWDHSTLLGGRPYAEIDYISKNSVSGRTMTLGVGNEWTLVDTPTIDLCGGVQVFYMSYESPRKHRTYNGFAAAPYLCLKKDNVSLNLVALGSKVLFLTMTVSF
jgi:hypothetical protein